jgi:hypothetical protein
MVRSGRGWAPSFPINSPTTDARPFQRPLREGAGRNCTPTLSHKTRQGWGNHCGYPAIRVDVHTKGDGKLSARTRSGYYPGQEKDAQ